MDKEATEAQDEIDEEPVCEFCDDTGITERQIDADDFEEEACECKGDDGFTEPSEPAYCDEAR